MKFIIIAILILLIGSAMGTSIVVHDANSIDRYEKTTTSGASADDPYSLVIKLDDADLAALEAISVTGGATSANQVTGNADLAAIRAYMDGTGVPVSGTFTSTGMTNDQYRENVPRLVNNTASYPLFVQATAAYPLNVTGISLSGGLTNTEHRAAMTKIVNNTITDGLYIRPGSNIPDATYIGDIKFGESAPLDLDYSTGATSTKTPRVKLSNEDLAALETTTPAISMSTGATDATTPRVKLSNEDLAALETITANGAATESTLSTMNGKFPSALSDNGGVKVSLVDRLDEQDKIKATINQTGTSNDVDVSSLPTAYNTTIANMYAAQTQAISIAPVSITGAGNHTIVTPTSGKKICVAGVFLAANSSVVMSFQVGGTRTTGYMYLNGMDFQEVPSIMQGADNQAFCIRTNTSVPINGWVNYYEVE